MEPGKIINYLYIVGLKEEVTEFQIIAILNRRNVG